MKATARAARHARRVLISVVGLIVVGLGVAMLVLPGPGLIVVALGFFILGVEFDWASRRFDLVWDKAQQAARLAVSRRWSLAGSILSALALMAAGIVWGISEDLPAAGWSVGGSLVLSGLLALGTLAFSVREGRRAQNS
jgi:hypothetical protein